LAGLTTGCASAAASAWEIATGSAAIGAFRTLPAFELAVAAARVERFGVRAILLVATLLVATLLVVDVFRCFFTALS
jgi:hypothetical protein